MKQLLIFAFILLASTASAQAKKEQPKPQIVAAACGQCQFDMEGHGCELAVRIDGKCYFVDGTSIDSHGDAHADDGFCNAVKKAEVIGEVKNGKFVVSYFKLLPNSTKK